MTTSFWIGAAIVLVVFIIIAALGPFLHIYGDTTDESALAGMDKSGKNDAEN